MKVALAIVAVLFGFILLTGMAGCGKYNSLVTLSEDVNGKWSQVTNQYQRRFDLIPNLVETVKGEAAFERGTLTDVTNARASVGRVTIDASKAPESAEQLKQYQAAQGQLGTALSRLMVVTERYPDLKANRAFADLRAQLEGTENRIGVARRDFNTSTQTYNTQIKTFPGNLVAGFGGFTPKPYFQADENASKVPTLSFTAK